MNARHSEPSRLGRWGARAVLATAAVLASVVAWELLLEYRAPSGFPFHNQIRPYVGFRAPPDCVWHSEGPSPSSRDGERALTVTNADGLRVPDSGTPSLVKPPGQLRVAVLGGSTVYNGTSFETTLPGALRRVLRRRFQGRDIEVLNAGIISAIARQELVHFVTTVVDYDIDLLVTYDGVNDSGQMLYYEKRPNFPYNQSIVEQAWEEYTTSRRGGSLVQVLAERSAILGLLFPDRFSHRYRPNAIEPAAILGDAGLRQSYAEAYIDNWERILRVCSGYGIEPCFVLQPTSLYDPDLERLDVPPETLTLLLANLAVYDSLRVVVDDFANAHPEVTVLDMADCVADVDSYYDGCHVYDDVNERIAMLIADRIQPRVRSLLQ